MSEGRRRTFEERGLILKFYGGGGISRTSLQLWCALKLLYAVITMECSVVSFDKKIHLPTKIHRGKNAMEI